MNTLKVLVILFVSVFFSIPVCSAQNINEVRTEKNLNKGWRFIKNDQKAAGLIAYDDSQWDNIDLPHTWNTHDGQDGGANYYRGTGWYRKHFFVDATKLERSYYLQFDGASLVATVYVNGRPAGVHKGAFGRFIIDVTSHIILGGDNIVAVMVNNEPNKSVAPEKGDFTICGGLYRDVSLLTTHKVHITTADYGGPGVYVTATGVSAQSADISIKTIVDNQLQKAQKVTVTATFTDGLGNVIKSISSQELVAQNGQHIFKQDFKLLNPHLWDAVNDPYLYKVTVNISVDKKITDSVTQEVGLRSLSFSPSKGFLLNGSKYLVKGVSLHQDKFNKGWALTAADQDETMDIIQEMGSNAIRSHYQMSPYWYELCRKKGVLVWGEIPIYQYYEYTDEWSANIKEQLKELIRQNYNNPAIIVWSIGNECGDNEQMHKLFAELDYLVKEEDPGRPTTYANNRPRTPQTMAGYTDVSAYNWYCGWYIDMYEKYGDVNNLENIISNFHKVYPDKAIGISEYGAGASVLQHQENPAPSKPSGPWHPEEYQSYVHERYWAQASKFDFLWGTFIWCMFDFGSDGRNEGETPGRNDKGMVSFGREYKKDAFYYYKAQWTQAPFVYITGRRANNRPNKGAEIKIYSNCKEVELFINGQSMGILSSPEKVFTWKGLNIANGAVIKAVGKNDNFSYRDEINWNNGR